MKTLLLPFLLSAAFAVCVHAQSEADKAGSGERFLEVGGKGSIGGSASGEGVAAGSGGSDRSALDLVNSPESSKGLKTGAPPSPGGGGGSLEKALSGGKGAVIGGAAGLVIGGIAGSVGGPLGTLGGAAGGAKLGAIVGAGIGFVAGFLMGGKEKNETTKALESRQSQLDEVMKGL